MNIHLSDFYVRISVVAVISLFAVCGLLVLVDGDSYAKESQQSPAYTIFVTPLAKNTNSIVYHARSGKLYASLPSGDTPEGNSIARINPQSGEIEKTVWVGSEPNKLALANDGNTLYVTLDGARAVRRFDIRSETAGDQFQAGFTNSDGPLQTVDISVSPSNTNVVAITRKAEAHTGAESVAIFDGGVRRPNIAPSIRGIAFADTESTLFAASDTPSVSELSRLSVNETGVTSVTPIAAPARGPRLKYLSGRIYTNYGQVLDATTNQLLGMFPLAPGGTTERPFTVENGRAFFISATTNSHLLEVFDTETFALIGSVNFLPVYLFEPIDIVRWGSNGIAVSGRNGGAYSAQSDLIGPGTVSFPNRPSSNQSTAFFGSIYRRLDIPNNSLIYNEADHYFYASVPSSAGSPMGNTITRIEPEHGQVLSSVFVGSEPNKLALSSDGTALYTSLDGAGAIRRYDTVTQTAGLQFTPANNGYATRDLAVLPGSPQTVAVSAGDGGIAVYDNGVKRPASPNIWVGPLEHNGTGNVLYGYNDVSSGFNFYKLSVGPTGLSVVSDVQNLIYRFNVRMLFNGGRIYCTDGRVIDPETNRILGIFNLRTQALGMTIDSESGKAFYLVPDSSDGPPAIFVYDIHTFNQIGKIFAPYDFLIDPSNTEMFRWGNNGLAFRSETIEGSSAIILLRSPLVSMPTPFDFDGDKKADLGIFRPSNGEWWINRSSDGTSFAAQFGVATDVAVPADYTGDGKTDIAVWRPSTSEWFFLRSEDFSFVTYQFGAQGDVPIPTDFTYDGAADAAVFRPSNGTWYTRLPNGGPGYVLQFGQPGDIPLPYDRTGDGRADFSVYRPSSGLWIDFVAEALPQSVTSFGGPTDKPVPGNYTGDGKPDRAFWRESTGEWFILRSEDGSYYSDHFGSPGDIPAPADYDGDGRIDLTVFRPSNGTWYSQLSSGGILIRQFGMDGDIPAAGALVR